MAEVRVYIAHPHSRLPAPWLLSLCLSGRLSFFLLGLDCIFQQVGWGLKGSGRFLGAPMKRSLNRTWLCYLKWNRWGTPGQLGERVPSLPGP